MSQNKKTSNLVELSQDDLNEVNGGGFYKTYQSRYKEVFQFGNGSNSSSTSMSNSTSISQ
jgi:hypothetical protein